MKIVEDYRNHQLEENPINDIKNKKNKLRILFQQNNPKIYNHYTYVSDRSNKNGYYNHFNSVYSRKCAYCGVSFTIEGKRLFEVDHYLCDSKCKEHDTYSHDLKNLKLSCTRCNRNKLAFPLFNNDYIFQLDPDENNITNIFYRDQHYKINISSIFSDDSFVNSFYKVMEFSHFSRQLDYFMLSLSCLITTHSDKPEISLGLKSIFYELLQYKNINT